MTLIEASVFYQLVALLVLASALGFVALKLRQPLIVAFIVTGLLAGPDVLDIVQKQDSVFIEALAQFGVALLLFMVGLKLDLRIIKQSGPVALIGGLSQITLTWLAGFLLSLFLGLGWAGSAFMGLALSFSSTIIAVKLLSDKRAIDSLYGRSALGILIIQDLTVIVATIVIAAMTGAEGQDIAFHDFFMVLVKAFVLIAMTIGFIKYAAEPITHMLARNTELMVLFCVAFAVCMAAVCEYTGFSKELGGLVAGIALASTPYNNVIAARLATLRDFMLLFFFAHLGAHMHLAGIEAHILPALVLSALVLVGKPLIIMGIMHVMRFRKRTGFLTGITLAQISEFSLILTAMGLAAGMLSEDILNLVTLVGLMTMTLSTYGIVYGAKIYMVLENHTALFRRSDKAHQEEEEHHALDHHYDIIIFGLGRYGDAIARRFKKSGYSVLGVDFDPDAVRRAKEQGILAVYGDAADPEFPGHLPLDQAKVVIFSFHHYMTGPLITDLRRTLAKSLREHGYKSYIAATSHHPEYDGDLPAHGIDIILSPFEDAAFHASEQVIALLKNKKI